MSARPKRKLCWNCEGNVQFGVEVCPYCGVSLTPGNEDSRDVKRANMPPPYKRVSGSTEQGIPKSPFATNPQSSMVEPTEQTEPEDTEEIPEKDKDDVKLVITTMAMLMGGGIFVLFGFILLLFSNEGYLQLRWSDAYWFVYVLIGLPMVYFGIQNLGKFTDSHEI